MKKIYFLLILFASTFLFKDLFSIYFFQDDFFMLSLARIKNFSDFLRFFLPHTDVQFYRPLSHELFFFVGKIIFGFNPLGFHFIVYSFYISNIYLVYRLSRYFLNSSYAQYFITSLFSISAIHYNSLFWLANFSYVLVTFIFLLSINIYLKYKSQKSILLIILFILGLLTNELMVMFPVVTTAYEVIYSKNKFVKNIRLFISISIVLFLYLIWRFIIFKTNFNTYKYIFDGSVISSLRWYFLWSFNWAETMKDQMLHFYQVRPSFLQVFSKEYFTFLINLLIPILLMIVFPLLILIKDKKLKSYWKSQYKTLIFAISWFILTLLPIVFIPNHISPHQGSIAIFGILLILVNSLDYLGNSLNKILKIVILLTVLIIWYFTSWTTMTVDNRIHWIYRRSNIARYWMVKSHKLYPQLKPNTIVIINSDDYETQVA